jgi:hypothetical protein
LHISRASGCEICPNSRFSIADAEALEASAKVLQLSNFGLGCVFGLRLLDIRIWVFVEP